MTEVKRVSPRVQSHVDALRAAGLNTQAFFDALLGIRDDRALPATQKDALYRLIAMECSIWYMEAIRGEPIDRIKLAEEAMKVAEQNEAAIKRQVPGGGAAELITKDIGVSAVAKTTVPAETRDEAPRLKVPRESTKAERPSSKTARPSPKKK